MDISWHLPFYVQNITTTLPPVLNPRPSLCLAKTQTTANRSINWLRCWPWRLAKDQSLYGTAQSIEYDM